MYYFWLRKTQYSCGFSLDYYIATPTNNLGRITKVVFYCSTPLGTIKNTASISVAVFFYNSYFTISFQTTFLQKLLLVPVLNSNNLVNSNSQIDARTQPVKEVQHLQQQRLNP